MTKQTPAVGRIIHVYRRVPGLGLLGPFAGLITQVFEGEDGKPGGLINCVIFPPASSPEQPSSALTETAGLAYSEDEINGDWATWWCWPPRV